MNEYYIFELSENVERNHVSYKNRSISICPYFFVHIILSLRIYHNVNTRYYFLD